MTDGKMANTAEFHKMITLSARLQALADMVTVGNRVCDMGCDHGYLSIYLVQHQISPRALAMDVGEGPLMRAAAHVCEAELDNYITLRRSDGLKKYGKGEADTLICAGMGGPLMRRLLEEEMAKAKSFRELILQPQSEIASFRRFLRESGWLVISENMVFDEGKFYPMMKAAPEEEGSGVRDLCKEAAKAPENRRETKSVSQELADRFGAHLLAGKHPVLREFLQKEWINCKELERVLKDASESERAQRRLEGLLREMIYLKEAAKLYGKDYD